jgi:hypothetical protein
MYKADEPAMAAVSPCSNVALCVGEPATFGRSAVVAKSPQEA